MPRIEVFADGCDACRSTLVAVESGKCRDCELVERDLARDPHEHEEAVRRYGVRVHPTIVIDGRIKVEGPPDFAWVCGDEFYRMLEDRYPLLHRLE